jgi:hypothetical protein
MNIPLNEETYFDIITNNNLGGISNTDSAPTYDIFEEGIDIGIVTGLLTQRTGLIGNYRGSFTTSSGNGFDIGKYYSVVVNAVVSGVSGKCVATSFRVSAPETIVGCNISTLTSDYDLAKTAATQISVNDIYSRIGAPTTTSISADIAAIKSTIVASVASSATATGNILVTGSIVGGDYTNTYLNNGAYYTVAPSLVALSGNGLNTYLQFGLSDTQVVNSVTIRGHFNSGPARYCNIYAYNWGGSTWDQLSDSVTRMNNATINQSYNFTLLSSHQNTEGLVNIGFQSPSVTIGDRLYIDQCVIDIATASATAADIADAVYTKLLTVVYEGGITIDTIHGASGTLLGTNGTIVNPVNNYNDAYTLATNLGVKRFYLHPYSDITLTNSHNYWRFIGKGIINLNEQNIEGTRFENCALISGTGYLDDADFQSCVINGCLLPGCILHECLLTNDIAIQSGKDITVATSTDYIPGEGSVPTFIFQSGASLGLRNYHGAVMLKNMATSNAAKIDGMGRVLIDPSCSGGDITVRGNFGPISGISAFEASGGIVTQIARFGIDQSMGGISGITFPSIVADENVNITGWNGATLPTSFSANNLPVDYLSTNEQAQLYAASTGTWYNSPTAEITGDFYTRLSTIEAHGDANWVTATGVFTTNLPDNYLTSEQQTQLSAAGTGLWYASPTGWATQSDISTAQTYIVNASNYTGIYSTGVLANVSLLSSSLTVNDVVTGVLDSALGVGIHDTTGTVGKTLLSAGSAGDPRSTTVPASYAENTAGWLFGKLSNIATKIGLIVTGPVTAISPVSDDLDIGIIQGDDYTIANGRSLYWTNEAGTWGTGGDITSSDVNLYIATCNNALILSKTGVVTSATATQRVDVELLSAETAQLTKEGKVYKYQLVVSNTGDRETIITGDLTNTLAIQI